MNRLYLRWAFDWYSSHGQLAERTGLNGPKVFEKGGYRCHKWGLMHMSEHDIRCERVSEFSEALSRHVSRAYARQAGGIGIHPLSNTCGPFNPVRSASCPAAHAY
jgi:hypothetical protein